MYYLKIAYKNHSTTVGTVDLPPKDQSLTQIAAKLYAAAGKPQCECCTLQVWGRKDFRHGRGTKTVSIEISLATFTPEELTS